MKTNTLYETTLREQLDALQHTQQLAHDIWQTKDKGKPMTGAERMLWASRKAALQDVYLWVANPRHHLLTLPERERTEALLWATERMRLHSEALRALLYDLHSLAVYTIDSRLRAEAIQAVYRYMALMDVQHRLMHSAL